MSGRYMRLRQGRYLLTVPRGVGPAGVHRSDGQTVHLDRTGGQIAFDVPDEERVYFWWRGPAEPDGLQIMGPTAGSGAHERRIA